MRRTCLLLALSTLVLAIGAPRAHANGKMPVLYAPGDVPVRAKMKQSQILEKIGAAVASRIRLPHDIPIIMDKCGQVNAFYDPQHQRIVVCDEIVQFMFEIANAGNANPQAKELAAVGALAFFLLHEMGHMLIDQLDLPAVGREEDSVDQFASIILIAGGDKGVQMAGYAGDAFRAITTSLRGGKLPPFWDEHSFDDQRFYNISCLIFGSNADRYMVLVERGILPKERAVKCPVEYKKISHSWERLLAPYAINVQNTPNHGEWTQDGD